MVLRARDAAVAMSAARGACGIVVRRSDVLGLSASAVSLVTSFRAADAAVDAVAAEGSLVPRLCRGALVLVDMCLLCDEGIDLIGTDGVLNFLFSLPSSPSLDADSARSRAAFFADITTPCILAGPPFIFDASVDGAVGALVDVFLSVTGDFFGIDDAVFVVSNLVGVGFGSCVCVISAGLLTSSTPPTGLFCIPLTCDSVGSSSNFSQCEPDRVVGTAVSAATCGVLLISNAEPFKIEPKSPPFSINGSSSLPTWSDGISTPSSCNDLPRVSCC